MAAPIVFYFDFVSPYGYLGSVGIERLAATCGRSVEWRPILLGISVMKVMGLKPIADTPLKGDYAQHDVPRSAQFMGIAFNRCSQPMQPLAAARAFVWLNAGDPGLAKRFAQAIYQAQWAEACDMSSADAVADLGAGLGIDRAALLAALQDDAVKDALRNQVSAAIAAGVFGVPTFTVDGEMFWGADRLAMVEAWIKTGGW
jgi:2-hydroxychromene-2-carboxylate isomerase